MHCYRAAPVAALPILWSEMLWSPRLSLKRLSVTVPRLYATHHTSIFTSERQHSLSASLDNVKNADCGVHFRVFMVPKAPIFGGNLRTQLNRKRYKKSLIPSPRWNINGIASVGYRELEFYLIIFPHKLPSYTTLQWIASSWGGQNLSFSTKSGYSFVFLSILYIRSPQRQRASPLNFPGA